MQRGNTQKGITQKDSTQRGINVKGNTQKGIAKQAICKKGQFAKRASRDKSLRMVGSSSD